MADRHACVGDMFTRVNRMGELEVIIVIGVRKGWMHVNRTTCDGRTEMPQWGYTTDVAMWEDMGWTMVRA